MAGASWVPTRPGEASPPRCWPRVAWPCKPGAWIPGLDQLPEAALPLLLGYGFLELHALSFLGTLLVFSGLDLLASRVLGSSRPQERRRRS
jgi:hypothetical protein